MARLTDFHREQGPTTTGTAKRTHTCDHYVATTEEPRWAVTSAHPRRPLRARLRHLKRRTRNARLWPRLWALNGPVPYQVSMTLERPEPSAQKI
jgi:hypothetical protein